MKVTYYGHSCFEINLNNKILLFDPFISPNPLAKNIDINSINPDYIFISHGHEDHIADAVVIARKSNARVISNYEIIDWLEKQGIKNTHPLNLGGRVLLDFGIVQYVNAIHSSVLPDGTYGGNPGGFIIESKKNNFYYAGDTALTYDMKLIGDTNNIDIAFLPIGDNFTMGIKDAIICSDFIKCNQIVGMHYNTFGYIKINSEEAIKQFKRKKKKLDLLKIGKSKIF